MSGPQPPDVTAPLGQVRDDAAERERREQDSRRRFDRGGRRRVDWPEDSGMTSCPGCDHEHLQSLGALDTGEYRLAMPAV